MRWCLIFPSGNAEVTELLITRRNCDKLLPAIVHPPATRTSITDVFRLEHEAGIPPAYNADDIDLVIHYAVRYDTDFRQFMLYTPVEGTPLHAGFSSR